jgi:hypothetical protein
VIKYNGDKSSTANGCVIIVADTVEFIGNSIISNASGAGLGLVPVEVKGVRLRE